VLFYYAVGHLAAMAQPSSQRLVPRMLNVLGLLLCLTLAISFGMETFLISVGILGAAFTIRWLWQRQSPR
jgi:hypothetical protein